jgi:two-component system, LytTR family, response regulator
MKVILVDDERLARAAFAQLLAEHPDVQIIGEAKNANEAMQLLDEHDPDVLFLDIQMPEKNGFELLEELPNCPTCCFCDSVRRICD